MHFVSPSAFDFLVGFLFGVGFFGLFGFFFVVAVFFLGSGGGVVFFGFFTL